MADAPNDVVIEKDLWDLIPTVMENRKKELGTLGAALAHADFEQLRLLGHRIKGVGASYGFPRISFFGKEIEDGARGAQLAFIAKILDMYEDYLSNVRVSCG